MKKVYFFVIALSLAFALQAYAEDTAPSAPAGSQLFNQPATPSRAPEAVKPANMRYLPRPPKTLVLCGERVPLEDPFIYEQLDREFNTMVHDQAQMVMCLKRAGRYFPYISRALKEAGLPDDLKYLAVTESYLLPYVQSRAGATGLWQFMQATGRGYNLKMNDVVDERLNPEIATRAAIDYFKYLYRMFKNWALVMAAYNCGEGRIASELKEQGASSYYELYLPRETMRYVFRIMAAKIILSDPEAYGYYLPAEQIYTPMQGDEIIFNLERATTLRELAEYSKSSVRLLRELNPELVTNTLPKGSYQLLVPKGQGANVLRQLKQEQAESAPQPHQPPQISQAPQAPQVATTWVVKQGDTLTSLAKRFGVSVQALKEANQLKDNTLKVGQKIVIPKN